MHLPRYQSSKFLTIFMVLSFAAILTAQSGANHAQAEAVLKKAIQNLGGEKYLQVKTQIGRGKFSIIRENAVISFQTFTDVIVFPDKERTEFKGGRADRTNKYGRYRLGLRRRRGIDKGSGRETDREF